MKRIYHRYEYWECWRAGFFWNDSSLSKGDLKAKVIEFFSSPSLVKKYMQIVVDTWIYSSQHNLSNESMNRVAWLGQAAACVYCKAPCSITMESWREVPENRRKQADKIALEIIEQYEKTPIQLCLKL